MRTPIILLAGEAGSGKDTAGAFLAERFGGVVLGHADPMKRFCRYVFDFSEDQLWGPTESRNASDSRYSGPAAWDQAQVRFKEAKLRWLNELRLSDYPTAHHQLTVWFFDLRDTFENDVSFQLSPRRALQTLGTDWGRLQQKDLWVQHAEATTRSLLAGGYCYDRTTGLTLSPWYPGPDYVIVTDGRFRNEVVSVLERGGAPIKLVRRSEPVRPELAQHLSETELAKIPRHFFADVIRNDGPLHELCAWLGNTMFYLFQDRRGIPA